METDKEYTTLWHDHFCAAHFVVALFGVAHFVAGPFWSGPFLCEFHKNNFFLLLFVSIFLIYKINFPSFFFYFFFKNSRKIFCLLVINFFPLYIKKYKFKHTATVFFLFSYNR